MKSKLNRVCAQLKVTFKPRNICLKAEEATALNNERFKGSDGRQHHLLKNKNGPTAFILVSTLKEAEDGTHSDAVEWLDG